MIKTIFSAILILTTISCAPLMEETWTVTTPEGPVTVRHYDPARELLLGFYLASLINPSQTQYSYPLTGPYLSGYSYCPPDIWADWTPLQRSLWIQSGRENELRDYEYKLQEIYDMQMFQMKLDAQSLMNDLERAKEKAKDELESKKEEAEDAADELKDAADDTKLELENAAWWAKFMESAVADAEVAQLVAENATTKTQVLSDKMSKQEYDFSFLANSLPGIEKKAGVEKELNLDWLNMIPPKGMSAKAWLDKLDSALWAARAFLRAFSILN